MKKKLFFISVISFLATAFIFAQNTEWKFDADHTNIQFSAVHMGISEVSGEFKDYSGTIMAGEDDFTGAQIKVIIKSASIDTDNQKRDDHLKSEDFLYVEEYPEIRFVSSYLKKQDGDNYTMEGELTIRGVTKTERFDVVHRGTVDAMDETRAGFKIKGTINRFDYDVDWNKTISQGLVVSKEINIICDVELIKE